VSLAPDAVYRRVAEETVLLQLADSVYHSLDPVGTRMFELLLIGPDVARALEQVLAEFDVDRATAERDLLALLADLEARGLVRIEGVTPTPAR
jgi:hypothetical protein